MTAYCDARSACAAATLTAFTGFTRFLGATSPDFLRAPFINGCKRLAHTTQVEAVARFLFFLLKREKWKKRKKWSLPLWHKDFRVTAYNS
jgi:hypothetical protein